jgi:hypothetical protein
MKIFIFRAAVLRHKAHSFPQNSPHKITLYLKTGWSSFIVSEKKNLLITGWIFSPLKFCGARTAVLCYSGFQNLNTGYGTITYSIVLYLSDSKICQVSTCKATLIGEERPETVSYKFPAYSAGWDLKLLWQWLATARYSGMILLLCSRVSVIVTPQDRITCCCPHTLPSGLIQYMT